MTPMLDYRWHYAILAREDQVTARHASAIRAPRRQTTWYAAWLARGRRRSAVAGGQP